MTAVDLPTVILEDEALYWVKDRTRADDRWTVAKWEYGFWWGIDGKEMTPRVISGPIPRPDEPRPAESRLGDACPRDAELGPGRDR